MFATAIGVAHFTEDEVLRIAASIDQGSEHPLANAIVEAARSRGLRLAKPDAFESATGIGVRGTLEGRSIVLGNAALLREAGADAAPLAAEDERLRAEGASVIYLAVDGQLAGLLAVHDPIKDATPGAIETLHHAGIGIVMATGDGRTTAEAVARKLGIDEVYGEVYGAGLQRARRADRSGCPLSVLRHPALAAHCRHGDVVELGLGCWQRIAFAIGLAAVM